MYTLFNRDEKKVIAELKSDFSLITRVRELVVEENFIEFSVVRVSDAIEYIKDYSNGLSLLIDSEVNEFLNSHGIEVEKNEPINYVELMMDNHKCIQWKNKQYYINDSLVLKYEEENIYNVLVDYFHV
jgi:hypothetical protein